MYGKIKKTKLLYKYDINNSASFHNYIDGKRNLAIIVRTAQDKIFGSFSTAEYKPNSHEGYNVESFIFAFNP